MTDQPRDAQGRYVTSDILSLVALGYQQRQEEAAAEPLTDAEMAAVDRVAEEVIAEDAREAAQKAHGDFLSSILFPSEARDPEGKPDDGG
jgi:hypothetical protein